MSEAHVRIDEGIKRGKRKRHQNGSGRARKPYPEVRVQLTPEKRAQVIQSVPEAILKGETPAEIAQRHGISASTIKSWIIGHPEIEAARGEYISREIAERSEEIDNAQDPMSLARAREGFKAWSWIAERREHRLFAQKQEVKIDQTITVQVEAALSDEANELLRHIRSGVARVTQAGIAAPLSPERVINPTSDEDK